MVTRTPRKVVSTNTRNETRTHLLKVAFAAVVVVLLLAAFKTAMRFHGPYMSGEKSFVRNNSGFFMNMGQTESVSPMPSSAPMMPNGGSADMYYGMGDVRVEGSGGLAPLFQGSAATDRSVIRRASLELLVGDMDSATENVRLVAADFGGIVDAVELYESPAGLAGGYVTIRVPATQFDSALDAIKKTGIRVERESVNSQDVTEQLVDIEARLGNLRAEEEQYVTIMSRADTVEETLKVVEHLYRVRESIEVLEAQQKNITSEVHMSTITAHLTAEEDIKAFGVRWRPIASIKEAVNGLLDSLAAYSHFMIAVIVRLPAIALWLLTAGVVAWLSWKVARRVLGLVR